MSRSKCCAASVWAVCVVVCVAELTAAAQVVPAGGDPSRRSTGADVAERNLAYSVGLPGVEDVNVARCLETLDRWARRVARETAVRGHAFRAQPEYYENSEAKFRMIQLVLTLQQDMGVGYDPVKRSVPSSEDLGDPSFFRDAKSAFLAGVLSDPNLGTCASLPVLVVAVGRKLGYPLFLVATKGHLFVRWDGDFERFNIEVAGEGVDFYPDEYYRGWPIGISEEEITSEGFLESMSADQEDALFLELRGYCLTANGKLAEGAFAFEQAAQIKPASANLRHLISRCRTHVAVAQGGGK